MKGPCKDCPKSGCGAFHDECEKYAAYKEEVTKVKGAMRKVADECLYKKEAVQRMIKHKRRKKTS